MNTRTQEIIGLAVITALLTVVFLVTFFRSAPNSEEVVSQAKPVEQVNPSILTEITDITNGENADAFPIQLPDVTPQDNPFRSLE